MSSEDGCGEAPARTPDGSEFGFEVSPPGEPTSNYEDPEHWSLLLPHQCGEWIIATGPDRSEIIAQARRFRTELERAIDDLEHRAEPEVRVVGSTAVRGSMSDPFTYDTYEPPVWLDK